MQIINKKQSHRYDIDGLRAIAVIAVIINHLHDRWLPSGHLGVDIFFVISGYVITLSLVNRTDQKLGSFLSSFYGRRVKRLMPALLVCVLLTSLAVILLAPQPQDSLSTGKMAMVGLSNIYLYNIGTNYIGELAQKNAFLQTWSLGVEEQFYFIFPLLFWIFLRNRSRLKLVWTALFISTLSLLSFALYLYRIRSDYWSAFYLLPSRFWELGLGVVTFLLLRTEIQEQQASHWQGWPKKWLAPSLQMILVIGLVAVLFADPAKTGVNTPLAAGLTALIIAAGSLRIENKTLLENRGFLWIGLISYSLYLWHWSVLYVARMLQVDINQWMAISLTAIMLLLASFSYYLIENPLRFATWANTPRSTILTGLLSVLTGIIALTTLQEFLLSWYPAQQANSLRSKTLMGKPKDRCHIEKADLRSMTDLINQCITILPDKNNAILIGNSHSLQYKPMVQAALPEWNVSSLTMWGCSYLPKDQFTDYEVTVKGCHVYGEGIKALLSQSLQKGDLVFLGYTVKPGITTKKLGRHVRELASAIRERGAHLVIFDGVYATPMNPEDCEPTIPMLLGLKRKGVACDFRVQSASNHGELLYFDRLMAGLTKKDLVNYIPARNWICPDKLCLYKQPNGQATFDYGSHLFQPTSQALAPQLRKELKAQNLLPPPK